MQHLKFGQNTQHDFHLKKDFSEGTFTKRIIEHDSIASCCLRGFGKTSLEKIKRCFGLISRCWGNILRFLRYSKCLVRFNLRQCNRSKKNHRNIIVIGQIIGSGQIDSFMCIESVIGSISIFFWIEKVLKRLIIVILSVWIGWVD